MRRIRILVVILIMAFIGLGWTVAANAQGNFRTGNDVTVPEGQTVSSTLFVSGKTVDIAGTVDGDVFCVGQDITVTGNITGDVICAGQSVRVTGTVGGNVRIAGQSVTIGGKTARSVTAAGQDISLDASGSVGGDASFGGQNVTLNGSVGRDAAIAATTATLNGVVSRDVQASATDLTLGSNARITGDLAYVSRHDMSRAGGAQVGGAISRSEPPAGREGEGRFGALIGGSFMFALYMFVAMLVVALALVLLIPQFIHDATEVAMRSPWKTLLVGFLASFIMPVVIVALMFTLIGIPLAFLLLLSWIVIVCLSVPFAAYYLGNLLISKNTSSPIWMMLLGTAIILVLYMIPLVGFIVWLVASWFGLGIILLQYSRLPRPSYSVSPAKR